MLKENLNENKVSFLKTSVPMYPDYQISDNMGEGLSENRKKEIKKDIDEFIDDYFKNK